MDDQQKQEINQQMDGLNAMLTGALKSASAPEPLFKAWDNFLASAKKWANGESIEQPETSQLTAEGKAQKIMALVNVHRRILPEPFALELEKILTETE